MLKYINKKRSEKGFTLVELMVVLLIIAILIAVAVPVFLGARSRAQDNVAKQALTNAARAAAAYYATTQATPLTGPIATPPTNNSMEEEEDSYAYALFVDIAGVEAAAVSNPPTLYYERTSATVASLYTESNSGKIWKITVTSGNPGAISDVTP